MSDMTQGDIDKFVDQYAKQKDITAAEAKRRIMGTGISRLKALSAYAGNSGGSKKASKKTSKKDKATAPKPAKKAAKKAAAKKAPAKKAKAKAAAAPAVSEGEEG